jgi:predicted dehydrogenase
MTQSYDIVGCGAAVQTFHAPVLRDLTQAGAVSIRACVDRDGAAAKQTARLLGAATSGSSSPDFDGVDAVIIATPPESHADVARRYLEAGKHVFLEKPFVVRSSEAQELVQLAESNGARLFVNHIRRFFPSVTIARRFVTSGGLGKITHVEATEGMRWTWASSSDYPVKSPYGGVVYDVGSHVLDTVLFVLGLDDPNSGTRFSIQSASRRPNREPSHECAADLELESPRYGRLHVDLRLSRREPYACAVKIYGESGTIVIPNQLTDAPILYTRGAQFVLRERATEPQPYYFVACFLASHQEFLRAQTDPTSRSPLDARNFGVLTSMLETLAA